MGFAFLFGACHYWSGSPKLTWCCVLVVRAALRLTCADCRRHNLGAGNLNLQIALLIRHLYDQLFCSRLLVIL